MNDDLRYRLRYLLFAWTYLECLGYAGIVFGWGSLVYVLRDEGFYRDLCDDDYDYDYYDDDVMRTNVTDNSTNAMDWDPDCDSRDGIFNLVFTIATTVQGVGIFLLGLVSLRFGTRCTRIVSTILFLTGSLCMAAASKDVPWLIFPGLSLIAVAGAGVFATNVQVSFLFPVWGSAVLSLLSGTFDASAGIQLLVKLGHENGISRSTSYYILMGVFCLTLINTFFFLPKHFVHKRTNSTTSMEKEEEKEMEVEVQDKPIDSSVEGGQPGIITIRKLSSVVATPEFLCHVCWFVLIHLTHLNYQASINSVLEDTLDTDDQVSKYTNAFIYTLLFGTVVSFLPGLLFDYNIRLFRNSKTSMRRRLLPAVCPLIMTSLMGALLSVFRLFTDPTTLYVEFVLVLILRAFLYSTVSTYMRQLFPSELFTTLYGIVFLGAGLICLLQYALYTWAQEQGSYQVYIFLLSLCVSTLIHPLYQWRRCMASS